MTSNSCILTSDYDVFCPVDVDYKREIRRMREESMLPMEFIGGLISEGDSQMSEVKSLVVYDRIADPMAAVKQLGRDIAISKMFGCENEEQGRVLAMTCFSKRIDPLALAERYHLIQGRLSMRSDAMLAGLQERGGSHRIIQRTADAAEIEIAINGDTQRFCITWSEAEREPFVWGKDKKTGKPKLKDNWATPRSRMQMLWARVVSDAVRAMCPSVVCGSYAPEELADMPHQPEDVPFEVVQHSTASDPPPVVTTSPVVVYATGDQVQKIIDLYARLNVPHETQEAALTKRGVRSLRSLTADQAAELLAKLEAKLPAEPPKFEDRIDGPCSTEQVERCKSLIREISQNGQSDIAAKVKAKLEASGLTKLADLTVSEAQDLIDALGVRNVEAFFTASLAGHRKN